MSTSPPPKKSKPPLVRKKSGEHAVVKEMRAKFESINEHTAPMIDALDERVERLREAVTTPPPTIGPEVEAEVNQDEIDTEPEICPACEAGICSAHQPPDTEKSP